MPNLYEELGVARDATPEEIKAAHRRKARVHHPDKGGDTKTFQQVQLAYDTLKDEKRRKRYDETGETSNAEQPDASLQGLCAIFQGIVDEMLAEGQPIETADMRLKMQGIVGERAGNIKTERESCERQLKRTGQLLRRFKRKRKVKGFDLMSDTLQRKQRDLTEQIGKMKEAEEIWHRAKKMLDDYTYKFDEPPSAPDPLVSWTTVRFG